MYPSSIFVFQINKTILFTTSLLHRIFLIHWIVGVQVISKEADGGTLSSVFPV